MLQRIEKIKNASFRPTSATKNGASYMKSITCANFLQDTRDGNGTQLEQVFGAGNTHVSPVSKKKMKNSQKTPRHCNSQPVPCSIKNYTIPKLHTGKCWYIDFYCFDPALGDMRRKRMKINNVSAYKGQKRKYAEDLINRLYEELRRGWNPFITFESENSYTTFEVAIEAYRRYLDKMVMDDFLREKTYKGYLCMLNVFLKWKDSQKVKKDYIYQFNVKMCNDFIDYIWLDLGRSGTTRDNYVIWLKTFAKFLLLKQYIQNDPTVAIALLGKKKSHKKNRSVIPPEQMARLKTFAAENNKHFLLACYVLYYCFIRPKEMSYIRIQDISVRKGTIFVPGEVAKNRQDAVVTLPDKVLKLMLELEIFKNSGSYYLFSNKMRPGKEYRQDKQFRDYWTHHVRKALRFPPEYKFYSLKDTGITDLIRDNADLLSVRDQARHHSLLMTDIYTPHDIEQANEFIRKREAEF